MAQMRSAMTEEACPVLFSSTYDAGDHISYVGEPGADEATLERKRTGAPANPIAG